MFGVLFGSSDVVSTSIGVATLATFGSSALAMLGMTWTSSRWRVPLALAGVALLVTALQYVGLAQVWFATQKMSAAYRYLGWFTVQPLQVASVFFLARLLGPVPVGVFWRSTAAAILMVLSRYLGDAGIFNPTLGVLLSIAFWLYILGELYFGPMSTAILKGTRPVRLGYFWIRLIFTIGWAIYPILHFVDVVIGVGHTPSVVVLYTIADLVNLIAPSLILLAIASQESY
jgi:sensory rhodopsin